MRESMTITRFVVAVLAGAVLALTLCSQVGTAKESFDRAWLAAALTRAMTGVSKANVDDAHQTRATEPARNDLAELAFLTGTWQGELNGEFVEEIWSAPHGNAMMGMFRWVNADGRSRMYELLTISREDEATLLRLRHFSSAMVAWEEKDAPIVLRLADLENRRAAFVNESAEDRLERIVFHQPEPGTLAIDVIFREDTGRAPLNFHMRGME